jgi:hypothetical protein
MPFSPLLIALFLSVSLLLLLLLPAYCCCVLLDAAVGGVGFKVVFAVDCCQVVCYCFAHYFLSHHHRELKRGRGMFFSLARKFGVS